MSEHPIRARLLALHEEGVDVAALTPVELAAALGGDVAPPVAAYHRLVLVQDRRLAP